MGVKWRNFQMPKRLECEESTYTETYGKFIAEPFEKGYGVTLGNSLRRILLSSIEGGSVTSIKVEGIQHEYTTIAGVVESLSEIILNIKRLVIRVHSKSPKTIYIKANKACVITGSDIICDEMVEVLNPDHVIATLSRDTNFNMEMSVASGRGYIPADINKKDLAIVGSIAVDSIFTPIIRVKYHVENTRVGQKTDYDKLIVEIWTNGGISPKGAMLYGSNILQRHLDVFVSYGQLPEEEEEEEEVSAEEEALYDKFRLSINELELSVRSANCLKDANIKTIAELVRRTEIELLTYRNFGRKSLNEIKDILKVMNLGLGMKVDLKRLRKKD